MSGQHICEFYFIYCGHGNSALLILKHGASLYLKFEGLNLSVVIIFKTFHWLKNFESCSVVSVARRQPVLLHQRSDFMLLSDNLFNYCRADLQSHLPDNYLANSFDT